MRILTSVIAAVLALALMAATALVGAETVLAALGRAPWLIDAGEWVDTARSTTWSATGVRWALAGAAAIGVVLLILALTPRRALTLAVPGLNVDGVTVSVRRRPLEACIEARIEERPYVTDVAASTRRSRLSVRAESTRAADQAVRSDVEAAVLDVMEQFGLPREEARVRVRKSTKRVS